jgi:hypothetical protein
MLNEKCVYPDCDEPAVEYGTFSYCREHEEWLEAAYEERVIAEDRYAYEQRERERAEDGAADA